MSKSILKLLLRKIKNNLPQLIGVALLIAVGTGFFVTLFTIKIRYKEAAEQYFADNKYADITYYADDNGFDNAQVDFLNGNDKIKTAEGRFVADYRTDSNMIIRVVSLTEDINIPYIYKGEMPQSNRQCLIVKRNATALNKQAGDTITVDGKTLVITGLMDSPEYIYLAKNERSPMADSSNFCILYTDASYFSGNFNEIVALGNSKERSDLVPLLDGVHAVVREEQINYISYSEDLDQIGTFAVIFPLVFALLIVTVIYVMLKRAVIKEHKQIGIFKALGLSNKKIMFLYIGQFGFIALIGSLIGCLAIIFITDILIWLFSSMFVVPLLKFTFYPHIWIIAIGAALLMCVFSGVAALIKTMNMMPSEAMRPLSPKNGKKNVLEKTPVWKHLSFNSRYALKSTLRNKGRFFAAILGICGACTLLVFSFGFKNSIDNTSRQYFENFANYDIIANFSPMPAASSHPVSLAADDCGKAFQYYSKINGERCLITIVESNFDMLKIPSGSLVRGVIIPQYYASQWGVKTGDSIIIEGKAVEISAVIKQTVNLSVFANFDYVNNAGLELPAVYNTMFIRSGDTIKVKNFLQENNITYSTIDEDKEMFESISKSLSILIWFMLICAIILGVTVLCSIGLINLSARQYEYMFMGVMGYPQKSIIAANIKESILQLIISVPVGFLLGNLLLNLIKGAFSGTSFALAPIIYLPSYLLCSSIVVLICALMSFLTARLINKLDIVEGLKIQDD